jgi:hypothetical protein
MYDYLNLKPIYFLNDILGTTLVLFTHWRGGNLLYQRLPRIIYNTT